MFPGLMGYLPPLGAQEDPVRMLNVKFSVDPLHNFYTSEYRALLPWILTMVYSDWLEGGRLTSINRLSASSITIM